MSIDLALLLGNPTSALVPQKTIVNPGNVPTNPTTGYAMQPMISASGTPQQVLQNSATPQPDTQQVAAGSGGTTPAPTPAPTTPAPTPPALAPSIVSAGGFVTPGQGVPSWYNPADAVPNPAYPMGTIIDNGGAGVPYIPPARPGTPTYQAALDELSKPIDPAAMTSYVTNPAFAGQGQFVWNPSLGQMQWQYT